ncbi:hypothetical protein BMI87_03340 [Thioclava sp. F28-4]|nr:hypothetical protein BMI87_03340 [Thioclava sp. F28-4]
MSLRIARRASLPVSGTVACALLESSDGGRSFFAAERVASGAWRVANRIGKRVHSGLAPVAVVRSPVAVQTVRIPALHGSPDISTYIIDPEGNMPGTTGAGIDVSVPAPRAKERTLHHVPFHPCIRREGVRAPRDPATTRAQRLINRSMGR